MLDQRLALDVVLMDSTNKSRDLEFFGVFREFSRSDDGGNFPLKNHFKLLASASYRYEIFDTTQKKE